MLAGILHDHRGRALVLAGHLGTRWKELHAIALDCSARRNIDVERGLAHRLGVEAAVFFFGDRQHIIEQDPGLVEAHGAMRRHVGSVGLGLIAFDHDLGQVAHTGRELCGIEQLRRHRIDVAEIVDVLAEGGAQLVELAVAGAGTNQHLEAQPAFARLAQEQGDVGIVSGMRYDVGIGALELGDQRREVGRRGRIAFAQHDLQAGLLGVVLVGGGDADAIGAVFVDERDLHVLGIHAELCLGVLSEETRESLAILVGVDLRAEHVFQVLVLEHGGRDRGGNPENLLLLFDVGCEWHRVRAGIDAVDDVDLFLADQTLDFVDRDIGLALRVRIDRHDLVLAADSAALVAQIDRDLRAYRAGDRASSRERAGVIEDDADAHRFRLGLGVSPIEA